jgi:5-methylcytosine-specific restriction enzyme subunit McrC
LPGQPARDKSLLNSMAGWKIHKVAERGEADVPIGQVLVDGVLDIFPEVLTGGYFTIRLKTGSLRLVAGSLVGLIPLNRRVAILVEPKVGRTNWLHIVGRSRAHLKQLPFLVSYSRKANPSQSIIEFLSIALVHQLLAIEQHGLFRNYLPRRNTTSFPKGRPLFGASMNHVWPRGHLQSLAVEYYSLDADNPHNRLLKFALSLAIRNIVELSTSKSELAVRMASLEDIFESVPLDSSLSYLPKVEESIRERSLPDTRFYYEDAIKTAILLVEQTAITPSLDGFDRTYSFIVNMDIVFQAYCYRLLKDNSHLIADGVEVEGETEAKIPLFSAGSKDNRSATPDVLLRCSDYCPLPIEIKYKLSPEREDINQAVTYAVAYNSPKVLLLCCADSRTGSGIERLGLVGGTIEVWVYRINLSAEDIHLEEQALMKEMALLWAGVPHKMTGSAVN